MPASPKALRRKLEKTVVGFETAVLNSLYDFTRAAEEAALDSPAISEVRQAYDRAVDLQNDLHRIYDALPQPKEAF